MLVNHSLSTPRLPQTQRNILQLAQETRNVLAHSLYYVPEFLAVLPKPRVSCQDTAVANVAYRTQINIASVYLRCAGIVLLFGAAQHERCKRNLQRWNATRAIGPGMLSDSAFNASYLYGIS